MRCLFYLVINLVQLRTRDTQITLSRQTLTHHTLGIMSVDLLLSRKLMIRQIS